MNDRNVAIHTAISWLLWPTGLILVCIGLVTNFELGQLGSVTCMVAATLTVRGYFCTLHKRERNAFEMGRDYEHGLSSVRRVR